MNLNAHAERLIYRIAGLPVAVSALWASTADGPSDVLQSAFVWRYWHPDGVGEWSELAGGLLAWPVAVLGGALWYTWRNGPVVRSRTGKPITAQFGEQLKLYFTTGLLAPWYYIFSLYDGDGSRRAKAYLCRFETKPSIFMLLKRRKGSPLTDKAAFADYCSERAIPCVPTLLVLDGKASDASLPDQDLFVKPSHGRGGTGAERWDRTEKGTFVGPDGETLAACQLLERFIRHSRSRPLIVQPRLPTHPELKDLTAGALPTVRIVTCLNERGEGELVGAVFRMSIGSNRTVDNLHAGGIAAAVDLASGRLSRATNLGADARLGWLSVHPDTNARIEGRALPMWEDAKRLAVRAHREFADRVVIGWDIAILEDGPIIVEGNGNPDMDILQRFMRDGLRRHRFTELLAYHLRARMPALA
jgi:glutathione synthase/RimK-type ligase-like ATP-grasp enzyme